MIRPSRTGEGGLICRFNTKAKSFRMDVIRFMLKIRNSVFIKGWRGSYENTSATNIATYLDSTDNKPGTPLFLIFFFLPVKTLFTYWEEIK